MLDCELCRQSERRSLQWHVSASLHGGGTGGARVGGVKRGVGGKSAGLVCLLEGAKGSGGAGEVGWNDSMGCKRHCVEPCVPVIAPQRMC